MTLVYVVCDYGIAGLPGPGYTQEVFSSLDKAKAWLAEWRHTTMFAECYPEGNDADIHIVCHKLDTAVNEDTGIQEVFNDTEVLNPTLPVHPPAARQQVPALPAPWAVQPDGQQ